MENTERTKFINDDQLIMCESPEAIHYFTNPYKCARAIDAAPTNIYKLLKGEYKRPYVNGFKISLVPREGVIEKFIDENVRYISTHKLIEKV